MRIVCNDELLCRGDKRLIPLTSDCVTQSKQVVPHICAHEEGMAFGLRIDDDKGGRHPPWHLLTSNLIGAYRTICLLEGAREMSMEQMDACATVGHGNADDDVTARVQVLIGEPHVSSALVQVPPQERIVEMLSWLKERDIEVAPVPFDTEIRAKRISYEPRFSDFGIHDPVRLDQLTAPALSAIDAYMAKNPHAGYCSCKPHLKYLMAFAYMRGVNESSLQLGAAISMLESSRQPVMQQVSGGLVMILSTGRMSLRNLAILLTTHIESDKPDPGQRLSINSLMNELNYLASRWGDMSEEHPL